LVIFSGRLSQVHVENLKAFPFIYFDGVSEAKLEHDISTVKEVPSLISYDLTTTGENFQLEKRCKALETAIRGLFWKEMKLKLSINGKEVYQSE
jgi:hypothetical protein